MLIFRSGTSYEIEKLYQEPEISEYEKKLNIFLATHEDINIQLSTITITLTYYSDHSKLETIKNILKRAINLNSDKYTIFLADGICHTIDAITPWCHALEIHEIHYQIEPENVMTYLYNIHKSDNDSKISESILLASQNSTYSNLFFNQYTIPLAQQINNFNFSNSLLFTQYLNNEDNDMYQFINEFKNRINENQLKGKGLLNKDIDSAINESLHLIGAIGLSMAQVLPPTSSFKSYCRKPIDRDDCIQVAKILMTDKSMINQGIGSRILNALLESQGKKHEDRKINSLNKKYKKLMCYMQSEDIQIASFVNKELALQYLKDSKQLGDLEAAKRMAFKIYEIEKQHGYNPDFNPNDC